MSVTEASPQNASGSDRTKAWYDRSFALIRDRLGVFQDWSEDARDHPRELSAAYKAFEEATQALSTVCSRLVEDLGQAPKDDYHNVKTLQGAGIISDLQGAALRDAHNLRNRLGREFHRVPDDASLGSLVRIIDTLVATVDSLSEHVDKPSGPPES